MSRYFSHAREPMNSYTHFWGAVLSGVGILALLGRGLARDAAGPVLAGALLFGVSLVALYSASSVYHYALCAGR